MFVLSFERDFEPDFRDLKESNSFIMEPDFVEFLAEIGPIVVCDLLLK